MPEFDRHVLETLREPLEAGRITISRAAWQADFPAACQLIAAMNPCPCGWRGDPNGRCRCTPEIAARYLRKLFGPLLDRIDIQIEIPSLSLAGTGVPVWMPTLFLADTALASRSVTGDTVHTYAGALLVWLRHLEARKMSLTDVTEETIGVYRGELSSQITVLNADTPALRSTSASP